MSRLHTIAIILASFIGFALIMVRMLAHKFYRGTTTADHPFVLFVVLMLMAGFAWAALIPVFKELSKQNFNTKSRKCAQKELWSIIVIGLGLRALFFGSVPIYEDDWNRYLWDGAVITQGVSPYVYSPTTIINSAEPHPDIVKLQSLSKAHSNVVERINNPDWTTLYPPLAQGIFTLAALIKPFSLDALRAIFLICEAATLFLMIKALTLYGRSSLWVTLYAFNPLLIYSGFNAVHMDIILPPFLLLALIAAHKQSWWVAVALSCAAAVKIWPLLLAPVLFRGLISRPKKYIVSGFILVVLSILLLAPLLAHLGSNSGLSAYSLQWNFSSFIFPWVEKTIALISPSAPTLTRFLMACVLGGLSLWFGFMARGRSLNTLPRDCLVLTLALLCLSPTGYPWYVIWVLVFIPFVPLYSAALLTITVALYYLRYGLSELGCADIYANILVPVQFVPVLLIAAIEFYKRRRHV